MFCPYCDEVICNDIDGFCYQCGNDLSNFISQKKYVGIISSDADKEKYPYKCDSCKNVIIEKHEKDGFCCICEEKKWVKM